MVNQSSRNGLKPRLIVLHTTEGHNRPGLSDLRGLVSFFDNPRNQVSSHVANDAEGNDARIVPDERKAFTQAAFNSIALSIEQIGFASQTEFPQAQLENTARWIAHWSRKWGIPIRHSTSSGVCQHRDLGCRGRRARRLRPELPAGQGSLDGEEHGVSEEPEIRFSGDDGDVSADALGIGYPQSAIDLAEAAEELSALEDDAASSKSSRTASK